LSIAIAGIGLKQILNNVQLDAYTKYLELIKSRDIPFILAQPLD
jgi:hypothetical protein